MSCCPASELALRETVVETSPATLGRPGSTGFLPFTPPFFGPEEAARLARLLKANPQPLSGYTYSSLQAWSVPGHYSWNLVQGETLLIGCQPFSGPPQGRALLQPVGPFGEGVQQALLAWASTCPTPLTLLGVTAPFLERHAAFCQRFTVSEERNQANYIYRAEDLATLAGKRYSKKRNLIAQARREYDWTAEPIGPANALDCLALVEESGGQAADGAPAEPSATQQLEFVALRTALTRFGALGLQGVLLRVGGEPVACALFDIQTPDTAVVMFERAQRRFKGLGQVINFETARVIAERGFVWINREEDLGDPGLRQAKLSYHPDRLEPAYTLVLES